MPRSAPRPKDSTKQIPQTMAGQAYGVAGEQQAALQAVPIPSPGGTTGGVPAAAGPPPPAPTPGGGPGGPPPDPNAMADQAFGLPAGATGAASGMAMPGVSLTAPTSRPDEPVTAGLPLGPGAGPEALSLLNPATRPPTPVSRVLSTLAAAAGNNPYLSQMAQEARTRGV